MNASKPLALLVAAGAAATALLAGPVADAASPDADQVLQSKVSVSRAFPLAGQTHNYRFNTWPGYWNVVATSSPSTGDVDLRVYDDAARTKFLGQSTYGAGYIDFVAIDGNHIQAGDFYPTVNRYAGTGSYEVEYAEGMKSLGSSIVSLPMAADDVVRVVDTYLQAGVTYTIKMSVQSGSPDGDLFLMGSTQGDPSTWVRSRSSALASSKSAGPGQIESLTFKPTVSDYYGVVVVNKAAGGTFILKRTS